MTRAVAYCTVIATLTMATGNAHSRQHSCHTTQHLGSSFQRRGQDPTNVYVAGFTETVYQLDGYLLNADEAKSGLDHGKYLMAGETALDFSSAVSAAESTTKNPGALLVEKGGTSSEGAEASLGTSSRAVGHQDKIPAPSGTGKISKGVNVPFPSGDLQCSTFPSDYGAVPIPWLGTGGWVSLQQLGSDFSLDSSTSVQNIVAGVNGDQCSPHSTCSYACPPGYQKSQWPAAQGVAGQSVGGLYCNAHNKLGLSNPQYKTLCIPGEGGITAQNDLDQVVSVCRTDYPGSEAMTIPVVAEAGGSVPLCNPDQATYYKWQGKKTSAQYYVNPKGVAAEDACVWKNPHCENCGNWAPINIGVGQDSGTTYLSIFQNAPTTNAKLDFNIEITGDVSSYCAYKNGKFIGGANGCTTGVPKGGRALFRFYTG